MDKEVGALAGRQPYGAVGQLARRDRLAVQGDELYAGVLDAQLQDARVAGVAEAQAHVGVMPDDHLQQVLPVQRQDIAEAPGMTPVQDRKSTRLNSSH